MTCKLILGCQRGSILEVPFGGLPAEPHRQHLRYYRNGKPDISSAVIAFSPQTMELFSSSLYHTCHPLSDRPRPQFQSTICAVLKYGLKIRNPGVFPGPIALELHASKKETLTASLLSLITASCTFSPSAKSSPQLSFWYPSYILPAHAV